MQNQFTFDVPDMLRVHRTLAMIAVGLFVAHCGAMFLKYVVGTDVVFGLVPLFDFYEEHNAPTYFSSFNLLLTSAMLFYIARAKSADKDKGSRAWFVLSFGFLFMSIDEMADLRIVLSNFVKEVLKNERYVESLPFFSVAWTVPMFFIVLMLTIYFVPFLNTLKKKYLIHFMIAGALFVFAVMGMETLGGHHVVITKGVRDITFALLVTIEESIEIGSILYFQFFLIQYIHEYFPLRSSLPLATAS